MDDRKKNLLLMPGEITSGLAKIAQDIDTFDTQYLVNEFGEAKVIELAEKGYSRRDFIIDSTLAAAGGVLWTLLNGCATPSEPPIHRNPNGIPQKLRGEKIQDPRYYGLDGCMSGFWIAGGPPDYGIETYKEMTGHDLSFYALAYKYQSHIPIGISKVTIERMVACANMQVIPFVTYDPRFGNWSDKTITRRIARGKFDDRITKSAENLLRYGEQHGGFFIRMFREMNLVLNWPWAGNPKEHKNAWKHVFDIFEQMGTNHYATWIWNPCVNQGRDTADAYYPGHDYVDWIGLNGYNWGDVDGRKEISFTKLFGRAYGTHVKKGKPMMICETGSGEYFGKPSYVNSVFRTIKNKYTEIKGLNWWSERYTTPMGHHADTRVNSSQAALDAFVRNINDDFMLKKIPYRKKIQA